MPFLRMRSEDFTQESGADIDLLDLHNDEDDDDATHNERRQHYSLNTLRLQRDSPERSSSSSVIAQVVAFLLCQVPLALSHVKDIIISILVAVGKALKLQVLEKLLPSPEKIPQHLGICVECTSQRDAEKLGLVLQWCYLLGIEAVTIYEASGFLYAPEAYDKLIAPFLDNCILEEEHNQAGDPAKKPQQHDPNNNNEIRIKIFQSGRIKQEFSIATPVEALGLSYVDSRPLAPKTELQIRLINAQDGHQDVVNLVKRLGSGSSPALEDISEELIKENLNASRSIPARLELLIVMPDYSALAHFPPELLRNAEILKGPSIESLTQTTFSRMIDSYANVKQRWGR